MLSSKFGSKTSRIHHDVQISFQWSHDINKGSSQVFFCHVGVWIWRAIFYVKATITESLVQSSESQLTNYKLQTSEIMNSEVIYSIYPLKFLVKVDFPFQNFTTERKLLNVSGNLIS